MSGRLVRAAAGGLALALCAAAVSAQEAPSAGTYAVRYDVLRRVTGTIAPDPDGAGPLGFAVTRNTYDQSGQLVRVEKGELRSWQPESIAPRDWTGLRIDSQVDTAYDEMGRKTREAVSGGGVAAGVTEYSYDKLGRLRCTARRMNPAVWAAPLAVDATRCLQPGTPGEHGPDRITRNHYTGKGDLAKVEEGVGTGLARYSATFTYTPNGKRESLTDANGSTARMSYDGLDRQSRWIFPSKTLRFAVDAGDYEEYGYDANGNRTKLRKRDGSILTFHYDALNRLSAKIVPERADLSPAQSRDVHYEYDNRGLMTAASFGAPGNDFVRTWYDGFGQPVTVLSYMSGQPRYLNHQYDRDGNREHLTFTNDNARFRFSYDGLGRMTAILDKADYSSPDDLVVRYFYRPEGPRHVAVFGSGAAGLTTGYYYDSVQRLAAIGNDLAAAGADWSINLAYNPAGQIVRRDQSHNAYAWTEARSDSRGYETNGLNQYTQVGPNRYEHDDNGNLTSDAVTTYAYDVENRLVAASNGARLAYDPLGRLAEVSSPGTGITRFHYDGDRLVAEYDAAGTLLKRYVHGSGTDEPVAVYEGPARGLANRRYLLADERGSIVALVATDGSAPAVNIYDEWGFPGRNNKGRFQYTGQTWIPELGLYYYKARFYSPPLGRFMQTDPIGYEDQLNLYAYVGNDPLNRRDPLGLYDCAKGTSDADCSQIGSFVQGVSEARDSYEAGSSEYRRLDGIVRTVGTAGDGNGITIAVGQTSSGAPAEVAGKAITMDLKLIGAQVATSMLMDRVSPANAGQYERMNGAGIVAHEIDHIMNPSVANSRAESLVLETHAFMTQEMVNRNFRIRDFEHRQGWGYGETWARQKALRSTNLWCSKKIPPC